MKLGIVGLPNVGKSTLFNSLTKAGALSANYPFATIDPNVGIVSVPDERIVKLGELYHTKKVTPATIEFVDIAGLVKGASKGEGLGNQFLANIREVDAIVHVVRCFEDTNIIHVDGSIDPARDIETINLELIFSDIEILDRRIAKISKQARMDKTLAKELELVEAIKAHLEAGKMARSFEVPDDEDAQIWFRGYNLLTAKPTIYAANVAEDDLADDGASNPHVAKVREMAAEEGAKVFVICAQIEQELAELSEEEKKTVFFKFNVEGLLRGDYASRMNGYATARQNGWMSANDIRELEDLDRIPAELGGDLYLVNGNMLPLNSAGAAYANRISEEKEEPDEETEEVLGMEKSSRTRIGSGKGS